MLIYYNQLYIFIVLILGSSISWINCQSSVDIRLKPPIISGNTRLADITVNADVINPCNGTYMKTNGTTCGLKEIMIGRCYEYQYVKRGLYLSNRTEIKNCTELYQLFETAVRFKPFCNLNMSTYEKYFQYALDGVHVINRAMFWSGTYSIAHTYSGHGLNYITLEDTLAAAMADGLMWCGKENDTEGFDYVSCPNNCHDNIWADVAFWGLASKTFAQKVTGEIYVVMNGSRAGGRPSFRNDSYFARFEVPNFQHEGPYRVTQVNLLLLHTPDQPIVEKCGEKSLIELEKLIRQYNIEYRCIDDPDELILLMCGSDWGARECQTARQVLRKEWDRKLSGKSMTLYHSTLILVLFSPFINFFFFYVRFLFN